MESKDNLPKLKKCEPNMQSKSKLSNLKHKSDLSKSKLESHLRSASGAEIKSPSECKILKHNPNLDWSKEDLLEYIERFKKVILRLREYNECLLKINKNAFELNKILVQENMAEFTPKDNLEDDNTIEEFELKQDLSLDWSKEDLLEYIERFNKAKECLLENNHRIHEMNKRLLESNKPLLLEEIAKLCAKDKCAVEEEFKLAKLSEKLFKNEEDIKDNVILICNSNLASLILHSH